MELYKTTIKGNKINVLFMSNYYVFHSAFYGYVAIAERNYNPKYCTSWVELWAGNRHLGGGSLTESAIIASAKRFIAKCERKYNESTKVNFTINENHDCNNSFLVLDVQL